MKQEQLIASIEQQLENLMSFDSELELEYELALYDEDGEPIVDLFTEELLNEILEHIDRYDVDI
jgi:hypothetical protein